MKLWKRATGAIKDQRSIWVAKLAPQSYLRNPILETTIIKATSHDEHRIDYKNVQRVMQWVGASPLCLKPLLYTLSMRMKKTQSWAVALKGLMLMHGIFCCEIPSLQKFGHLPFDLSNFSDYHLRPDKVRGFNAFIRAYFAYLDQRSAFVASEYQKKCRQGKEMEDTLMDELETLQKMQILIDVILQIKPQNERMNHVVLILEAMDCVIVELFNLYGKFCKGMSQIFLRIYDMGGKEEASIGLSVVQKAAIQGEELSWYFEFCKEIGVVNASQSPKVERISEESVRILERIANGNYEKIKDMKVDDERDVESNEEKAIVLYNGSKTVITDKWEVFEDNNNLLVDLRESAPNDGKVSASTNPSDDSYSLVSYNPDYKQVLPDLINF